MQTARTRMRDGSIRSAESAAPSSSHTDAGDPAKVTNDSFPVRLRSQHIICLQFMHGVQQSPEFARALMRLLDRLTEHPGTIVVGPDDLCARCPQMIGGVCTNSGDGADVLDALACQLLGITAGSSFDYGVTSASVPRILQRWRALACAGCPSESACAPMIDLMSGLRVIE